MRYFFVLFLLIGARDLKANTYYFSANSGNDSRTAAAAMNMATPWKTLAKLNAILGDLNAGDSVLLKRDEVFEGSLMMSKSGGNNLPIVFAAYGTGAKPVITGLTTLTGWTSTGNGTWETSIASPNMVNIVLLNGEIKDIGRYPNITAPNKGYLTIKSANGNTQITSDSLPASPDWTGGEVVIRKERWVIDRNRITRHAGNTIDYVSESDYNALPSFGFFIQNHPKTLDITGEWYYRLSDHKIGIYLQSGTPASYNIQASTAGSLVTINGLSSFVFDNIRFTGGNNSAFSMSNSQQVRISNCDLLFSGKDAVYAKNTNGITVENSVINHSYNNALDLDNCSNLIVRNNKIKNSGMTAGLGNGGSGGYEAILLTGNNVLIERNDIDSTGYNVISYRGDANEMRNNFINNFSLVKDDAAAIYTWNNIPNSPVVYGTKITSNVILNGIGAAEGTQYLTYYPVHGIYMDDNTFNAEITGNTIAQCALYGIYVHNAHDISLNKNTFYNSRTQMVLREDVHAAQSTVRNMRVFNNIFFAREYFYRTAEFGSDNNDISQYGVLDSNYYCRPVYENQSIFPIYNVNGAYVNDAVDLDGWKALFGKDQHSKKSPVTLSNPDLVRFEYNGTGTAKSVPLDDEYIDVYNTTYTGSVTLAPYTSVILLKSKAAIVIIPASTCPGLGNITREEWDNIPGNDISKIPLTTKPDKISQILKFETNNSGDSFGARISGYLCPPISGSYNLMISGDDQVELWLSTDDNPANKKKIAYIPNWTNFHEFDKFPSQTSAPVTLRAGQRYYVEALHKEGDVGDHITVAWKLPNGLVEAPILGNRLLPITNTVVSNGLNFKYYEGAWTTLPDFNTLVPVKTGNSPNVDIGVRTPGRNDNFAFVWEGNINITTPGTYTFETMSDDGSNLYFSSLYNPAVTPTVNNDGVHWFRPATGTVNIPAAGVYPISITYFEKDGGEQIKVYWTGPGITRQLIPNSAFMQTPPPPPTSGLTYKYYEGAWNTLPDFNALTPVKTGNSTNADISVRTPGRDDNFAFVWEGNINITTPGTYTFETISDDGSNLYFNSLYNPAVSPTVNNDGVHWFRPATGTVYIPSAGVYPISITYFEKDGGEQIKVYWTGPGITRQLIPNSAFTQTPSVNAAHVVSANRLMTHDVDAAKENVTAGNVYPNPFKESFNISFYNSSAGNDIQVGICDLQGRFIYRQHLGNLPKGNVVLKVNPDGRLLPWGVYMTGLRINGIPSKMVKLVKMK